eukprot:1130295-Pelagomonas_calceolata.AAC.1
MDDMVRLVGKKCKKGHVWQHRPVDPLWASDHPSLTLGPASRLDSMGISAVSMGPEGLWFVRERAIWKGK